MRILPEKFNSINKSGTGKPALIVSLQTDVMVAESTYKADWTACSSFSNVIWDPASGYNPLGDSFPTDGDVVLKTTVDTQTEVNTVYTEFTGYGYQLVANYQLRRRKLLEVETYWHNPFGAATYVYAQICKGATFSPVSEVVTMPLVNVYDTVIFSFKDQDILLDAYEQFWIHLWGAEPARTKALTYSHGWWVKEGQGWGAQDGTAYFICRFTGQHGHFFVYSGSIITKTLQISGTPNDVGEFVTDDVIPGGTALWYEAWCADSATLSFPNSWTYVGTVQDGTPLTNQKVFWRAKASFNSTPQFDDTPIVSAIRIDFSHYERFSNRTGLGLPVSVMDVGNLSMEIDLFKGSTIGQIDIQLSADARIRNWLAVSNPKNKTVKVLAGFIAEGYTYADFVDYRWGQIDEYTIEDDILTITMKDFSKEWDADVPKKWTSATDDVTYTGSHHCDVIKDVLLNKIAVRDSRVDIGSLATVKSQTSGYTCTHKITGDLLNAKDIIDDLRILLSSYFIYKPTGMISIKRWNPNETPVLTLTDKDFITKRWESNAGELRNRAVHYYNWCGSGDDTKNYSSFAESVSSWSMVQFQEVATFEFRDQWTTAAGSWQVLDFQQKLIWRYYNGGVPIFRAEVDRKFFEIEPGDMLTIKTRCCPSTDNLDVTKKFQVVRTELDFMKDRISLVMKDAYSYGS